MMQSRSLGGGALPSGIIIKNELLNLILFCALLCSDSPMGTGKLMKVRSGHCDVLVCSYQTENFCHTPGKLPFGVISILADRLGWI
jgi:hypothetical protein